MPLTASRLRELMRYCAETGEFTWRVNRGTNQTAGKRAGARRKDGYWAIIIDKEFHLAHRAAFLYMTGEFPSDQVDHIDTDRGNNAWSNLRQATNGQNIANRTVRTDSKSGIKGVQRQPKTGKWRARVGGLHIGVFDTPEQAHEAFCQKAADLRGEFFRAY